MRRPPNLTTNTPATRALPAPNPAEAPRTPANYLDLYGLSKAPFGAAQDSTGYILFSSHRRVFEAIVDHMVNGTGLLLVQGEEGIGKTETLRAAAAVAGESGLQTQVVARMPGERTSLTQLISALGYQSVEDEANVEGALDYLLQMPRKALLIDDVDLMPENCVQLLLSLIARLSDVPGSSTIILTSSTEPTSDEKRTDLVQLYGLARNTVRMPRLGPAEVRQYVERSLWIAGGTTRRLITTDAMKLLILRSGGVPGTVNRLMEAAFTAGFARGDATITAKTVAATVGPVAAKPIRQEKENARVVERAIQFVAVGLLLIGGSVFLYQGLSDRRENQVAVPPILVQPAVPVRPPVAAPPVAQPLIAKPVETLPPGIIAALIKRGDQAIELGDIAAARLLFQRAAEAGNAGAATALGKTYDPTYVPPGGKADPAKAAEWYQKATKFGDPRAGELLKRLGSR